MRRTLRHLFLLIFLFASLAGSAQSTTLIDPSVSTNPNGSFENGTSTFPANGWTLVNGSQTNKWWVGTAAPPFAGSKCAYISNQASGSTYNYNVSNTSVVHFYRDITFPSGEPYITLTFRWKAQGESCCDYLRVHLVPTSTAVTAGTMLTTGQIGTNMNGQNTWQSATLTLPCSAAGTTQRLVFTWRNDFSVGTQPPASVDEISLVSSATGPSCSSLLGTGVTTVASLPYASGAGTTCGAVNDLTASNTVTCGSTSYLGGEDRVWVFTPTSSGQITVNLTSSGSWTGLMLYDGCPVSTSCSGPAANCVAYVQSSAGNQSFCTNVISGTTYYLILDSWPSPTCNPYSNLTISAPSGAASGTTCSNAVVVSSLPYSATGQTTLCFGNEYTNASTGSCGTLYESGEDKVYTYTATASECLNITITNASTNSVGFQVYNGCPGSPGTTCVASAGGATSGTLTGQATLPGAGTYYIIVDTWANPTSVNYDLSITSMGSGPSNDLPCNATSLPLTVTLSGDNTCSGGSGEPAVPGCWFAGNVNTVWYSIVCPSSGQIRINTALGTLLNTQIALFSGTCSSLSLVTGACNDDIPPCGSSSYENSYLLVTGLTPGNTYYLAIDGYNNQVGTFDVTATDGSLPVTPAAGQECVVSNPVCASTQTIGNPGYQAYGNICDFPGGGTNCLLSGERGSAWYTIPINANGNLEFDIVPNDYGNPNPITGQSNPGWTGTGSETDYDFAVWKIVGSGSTTCAGIAAGDPPLRCNYSGLGVTGCFGPTANTAPPAYSPAYDGAYDSRISVSNGEVYVLVVSNFSNSTSGFSLVFSGTSPVNYTSSSSSITWSGGTNSNWALASNWGNCSPPTCTIDATIVLSSSNQPVISSNASVRNLTINAGATLTINPGVTLTICGDYTNNGTLIAAPTSTILFNNGSVVHNLNGNMVGTNKFGNLTITKTGGSVVCNQNLDIGGNFTTSNATSVFNTTGKYIRVAGNFSNSSAGTTFTNVGTIGTLEFNGSTPQTYTPGGALTLNNVVMNQSVASTVTLSGNNMILGTSGTLTLTMGKIVTNTLEVTVNNTSASSVSTGNTNSYVEGYLRRYLPSATGSFNFPVGHSLKGYQRANITFTAVPGISNLLARFDPWVSNPGPQGGTECAATYNMNALDNGYWTITAPLSTSGTYNMTLYNTNYTNNTGASGWTVMKNSGSGWALNGTCVTTSTAPTVSRNGMSGFSLFGNAQSTSPLPIELLSFEGVNQGATNLLSWITATETNNDYFTLERSLTGTVFELVTQVDGAGNSNSSLSYSAVDENPYFPLTYYRLKQTDFNGDFSYSQIIAIQSGSGGLSSGVVRPNPTTGVIDFHYHSISECVVKMEFFDQLGKLVLVRDVLTAKGKNSIQTDLAALPAGVYQLKVTAVGQDNLSFFFKVVKY